MLHLSQIDFAYQPDDRDLDNPEGCQKVAGGRSEAKTSGSELIDSHPEGVPAGLLTEPDSRTLSGC